VLTETPKLLGLDGQKMSKSYDNAIMLRDPADVVTQKIRKMQTDPARVRRTDPGEPERCPVWTLHKVYSDEHTKEWVLEGSRSAGIGCLECKQPVIEAINAELKPIRERAAPYEEDPTLVRNIVQDGCEKASDLANDTMRDVREAMGLNYS
jgi:tryptophanyl-tRNA synthetase